MNHTDYPWSIVEGPNGMTNEIIGNIDGGYGDDGSQIRYDKICEVNDELENWKDNAKIIEAAPDMYKLLKRMSGYNPEAQHILSYYGLL